MIGFTESRRFTAFLSKVEKNGSIWNGTCCWEWQGSICETGYGQFWDGNRLVKSHRWSYEYFNKKTIPIRLDIDHLCRNRKCVNPSHLELVTRSENIIRGLNPQIQHQRGLRRTHCKHGHLFDATNTFFRPNGGRTCRACKREQYRKSHSVQEERYRV